MNWEKVELDPFTKKRVIDATKKVHFDNNEIYTEMAQEFGRRVAFAEKDGIPLATAFEMCREHFKIVGKAMIDIASAISLEMCNFEKPKEPPCNQ